jgi:hypothetical protein
MAIRPKIKKSSDPWADVMKEIDDRAKMLAKLPKSERGSMRYSWERDLLERIKAVPKKVVQAKVKVNKNAPKPSNVTTGNVTVIPKGSKPKTLTNAQKAAQAEARAKRGQSQKGGRSSRGGGMGGTLGGGSLTSRTK